MGWKTADLKLVKEDGSKAVIETDYQSMISSLLYLAIFTRPDIYLIFSGSPVQIQLLSYGRNPFNAIRVFRYLQGTIKLMLKFSRVHSEAVGYCDASWGDNEDRHSTDGVVLSCANSLIVWIRKRQPIVALSTAEAKYNALFAATKEAIWLRQLCSDFGMAQSNPTKIDMAAHNSLTEIQSFKSPPL